MFPFATLSSSSSSTRSLAPKRWRDLRRFLRNGFLTVTSAFFLFHDQLPFLFRLKKIKKIYVAVRIPRVPFILGWFHGPCFYFRSSLSPLFLVLFAKSIRKFFLMRPVFMAGCFVHQKCSNAHCFFLSGAVNMRPHSSLASCAGFFSDSL